MIIMGIDPGSRVTGYGVLSVEGNRINCIEFGTISAAVGADAANMPSRLNTIYSRLEELVERFRPAALAVEGVFYAANVKSALTLGHARGVVFLLAGRYGIPLAEYSPLEVKKAVAGYGRADKEQVQSMVRTLLNLSSPPSPFDASDALAIALCQAFQGKFPRQRGKSWRSFRPGMSSGKSVTPSRTRKAEA